MDYPEVLRVLATAMEPNYDSPWQTHLPTTSTGSAVVIGKGELLTGAHVVAHATFLQVQKPSHPDKATARVKAVNHDCDLALLEIVDPPDFLDDITPAELGDMPKLRDEVAVVGYPVGGEELSITEGVVSRIEVQRYAHSQRHLLAATVDAAINAGSSGGPVFGRGKVVGIAFQKLDGVDNIGEMVPPPIIAAFLHGVAHGKPARVPAIGLTTQNLENPFLRKQLGMRSNQHGIAVTTVDPCSAAAGQLQPRDVITSIAGHPIANNGTVQFHKRYRTRFDVVLGTMFEGDPITLEILRQGQARTCTFPLVRYQPLVARAAFRQHPPYVIYGGLVFQALSRDYLTTWAKWWNKAPKEFLYQYHFGARSDERHEVVILSQVLADDINVGYTQLFNEGVVSVNGVMPRDLAHFAALVDSAQDTIEFKTSSGGLIAFDPVEVAATMPRILARYRVPAARSAQLSE